MFHWSPDTITAVATYLKQGLSAAQIGAQLGISRNAVIGKVGRDQKLSRIGFARVPNSSASPEWQKAESRRLRAEQGVRQRTEPTVTRPRVLPVPSSDVASFVGRPLTALGAYECKWAVTDHEEGAHLFCGCKTVSGKSWCDYHASKAFDPRPRKSLEHYA